MCCSKYSKYRILVILGVLGLCAPASGYFNITDYGAAGADLEDDRAAIEAAIEAARENGGGTVYFPTGTYVVSPPGTAVVSVYENQGGSWVLVGDEVSSGEEAAGWAFTTGAPVESTGSAAAEQLLDLRSGSVYARSGGGWEAVGKLIDNSGEGWSAGYGDPVAGSGGEGEVYLRYHVESDHQNGAVFEIHPSHNNITFLGDGPGKSVLSFRTWGGGDPMDYEVDTATRSVISSSIPCNGRGRYMRGSLFVMKQEGTTEFENIHWEGLEMRGNTVANGKDGWYTAYDDLEEWDISNKCIVFTFGARPMHKISVSNCAVHGWRGEILYKGGSNYAEILIENCDIYETNSSAVSISGNMVMRDSRIWNTYNGVENYCDTGQYSEIYNCEIDLDQKFRGKFGVVYLGTEDAYLIVEGNRIKGARNGAIFLSDFAHNVRIADNVVEDSLWGVYIKYMNLYGLPGGYNNLLIENNTFTAREHRIAFVILNAIRGIPGQDWIIRNNEVVSDGEDVLFFFASDHQGPREDHNVLLSGNRLPNTQLFRGSGLVPVYENNVSKVVTVNTYADSDGFYDLEPENPRIALTYLAEDDLRVRVPDLDRYLPGHRFELKVMHGNTDRALLLEPAGWNTLTQSQRLYREESMSFVMGSGGRFEPVTATQPDPVAPQAPSISVDSVGIGSVTLSWSSPEAVEAFELQLSEGSGSFSPEGMYEGSSTAIEIQDLVAGAPYRFRIRAFRSGIVSEWAETPEIITKKVINGVAEHTGTQAVVSGMPARLSVNLLHSGDLTYEWYAGQVGDFSMPLGTSAIGEWTTGPLNKTGVHSFWVRILQGADVVDQRDFSVHVLLFSGQWAMLTDFNEEPSGTFLKGLESQADGSSTIPPALIENRWTDPADKVLRVRNDSELFLERSLRWIEDPRGLTLFFRFRIEGEGGRTVLEFHGRDDVGDDLPDFKLVIGEGPQGNSILGPGGDPLVTDLHNSVWYEAFLYLDIEEARYSMEVGFPSGIDPEVDPPNEVSWQHYDGLARLVAPERFLLRAENKNSTNDTGCLLLDDFWITRGTGRMPPPVAYSYWQNHELNTSGMRPAGLGLLLDINFPWIYFPVSGAWAYLVEDYSSRLNIWGVLVEKGKPASWFWTSDLMDGWYFHFGWDSLSWRQFPRY